MEPSNVFIEKIKRSIIINFMIENDIKNINIDYDKDKQELDFLVTEYTKHDIIKYNYKIPKRRSKKIKKSKTNNVDSNTDEATTDEVNESTNDVNSNTDEENESADEEHLVENNKYIGKHLLNNHTLKKDEDSIHHQPKHQKYMGDDIINNVIHGDNNNNKIEKIGFNINMFINDDFDLNLFTKDEYCLLLFKNILTFEKKLIEKKDFSKLKNVLFMIEKIRYMFNSLGFNFDVPL